MKWRRLPRFESGAESVPKVVGDSERVCPCNRRRAGKAISTAVTKAETGFPGNPTRGTPRSDPKNSGFPGLMATRKKSNCPPNRSQAGRRKSRSPTEAPPAVTTKSPRDTAESSPAIVASNWSGRTGSTTTSAPADRNSDASSTELLSWICPEANGLPGGCNSSPQTTTTTRTLRRTRTSACPAAAARAN